MLDVIFTLSVSTKDTVNKTFPTSTSVPIKLRFDMGPAAESLAPSADERGHLCMQVCGLNLELGMSSLTSLTDLIEDERIPLAMPMSINIHDCDITLKVRRVESCAFGIHNK